MRVMSEQAVNSFEPLDISGTLRNGLLVKSLSNCRLTLHFQKDGITLVSSPAVPICAMELDYDSIVLESSVKEEYDDEPYIETHRMVKLVGFFCVE